MERSQVATQIEKLLSKLIFDKKGVKISVKPISNSQHKEGVYPTYSKYIVNIYVDPYKYNNVTSDYNEDYYTFMSNVEDIIDDNVKYIGIEDSEIVSKIIIDKKEEFIIMMEKIIYDKWEDVERMYRYETGKDLPEVDEISVYPKKNNAYAEFVLHVGLREKLDREDHTALWNTIQEKLPVSEMFVEIV
jgi:hypothetical protein